MSELKVLKSLWEGIGTKNSDLAAKKHTVFFYVNYMSKNPNKATTVLGDGVWERSSTDYMAQGGESNFEKRKSQPVKCEVET